MFKVTWTVTSPDLNTGSVSLLSHFKWEAQSNGNQKGMLEKPAFPNQIRLKDLKHTLNISFKIALASGAVAESATWLLILPEAQDGWHSWAHFNCVIPWALSKDPKISLSPTTHGLMLGRTLRSRGEWQTLMGPGVQHRGKGVNGSNQFH